MRKQPTNPLSIVAGIAMTVLCLALAGGVVMVAVLSATETKRPAIPQNLPGTLEEVKTSCADGECITGCLQRAAEAVGYEKYPPVMDDAYESPLVTYKVDGNRISDPTYPSIAAKLIVYQRNRPAHDRIWNYFTSLVPEADRPGLQEFVIYSGGESGAQFSATEKGGWVLYVNVLEATDPEYLTHALVHEYGHFITLNPTQQTPEGDEATCKQEPLYGCPAPDSYTNRFFEQFWPSLYPEWMGMKGATNKDLLLEKFYKKYGDQFVTWYASTQPLEDLAETWTYFITSPKPTGQTVADQKVLFFYQFPELVDIRYKIITGICSYEPPPQQD